MLVRKLGIADTEIGTAGGTQRVQLFADTMAGAGEGASKFQAGFAGGTGNFADSQSLWNTDAALSAYDIVILSCEGAQHRETKSQAALTSLENYSEAGGRVFMSHWHNIWIEGDTQDGTARSTPTGRTIATWNVNGGNYDGNDTIDEANNPKGGSFATWMLERDGLDSPRPGRARSRHRQIDRDRRRQLARAALGLHGDRWQRTPQMFQFLTSPPPNAPVGDANSAAARSCSRTCTCPVTRSHRQRTLPGSGH